MELISDVSMTICKSFRNEHFIDKILKKPTRGNLAVSILAANGVQNKFDRIIFSSGTLCSFKTVTAFTTVLPVPVKQFSIN